MDVLGQLWSKSFADRLYASFGIIKKFTTIFLLFILSKKSQVNEADVVYIARSKKNYWTLGANYMEQENEKAKHSLC